VIESSLESDVSGKLPQWFRADEVYAYNGQWYFGSREGLHIGPYAEKDVAKAKGTQVAKRLRAMNEAQQLKFVRKVLDREWDNVSRLIPKTGIGDAAAGSEPPPKEAVRRGEGYRNWYRSGRYFQADGAWFFSTREGIDVGPFETELEAKKHERRLVTLLERSQSAEEAFQIIHEYKYRPSARPLGRVWANVSPPSRTKPTKPRWA
jgi:hypothetical protein